MYSYFAFIFLTFATVFAFAQCDGNFTEISDNAVTCDGQILRKVWEGIACKPRDTVVDLNPKPGQMFFPPVVSVPRCGGDTPEHSICEPTNTTSVQIEQILVKITTNGSKTECRHVNVEKHIHCSTRCRIKETDCKTGQSYKQTHCKCECTDQVQRNECSELKKKMWNEEKCQCVCKEEEECTNGSTWNKEFCKCL